MKSLNNLFAGIGLIALVVIAIFMTKFSNMLDVKWALLAIGVYMVLVCIPLFIKRYYKMKDYDISWLTAIIPVYNESTIMSPFLATLYLISAGVVLVELLLMLLPNSIVQSFMGAGSESMTNWFVLLIRALIVTYAVLSVIRGIAYIKIFIDIEETKCELNDIRPRYSIMFIASSILSFIPIARVFGLIIQHESLRKATLSLYLKEPEYQTRNNQYDWNNF